MSTLDDWNDQVTVKIAEGLSAGIHWASIVGSLVALAAASFQAGGQTRDRWMVHCGRIWDRVAEKVKHV